MSASETRSTDAEKAGVQPVDDHHPTPRQYVEIAVVLAVLTALEVAASFVDIGPAFLPTLIILMTIKFALVAGWFMHLKYDTRLYSRFMVGGLVGAIVLYGVVVLVHVDRDTAVYEDAPTTTGQIGAVALGDDGR